MPAPVSEAKPRWHAPMRLVAVLMSVIIHVARSVVFSSSTHSHSLPTWTTIGKQKQNCPPEGAGSGMKWSKQRAGSVSPLLYASVKRLEGPHGFACAEDRKTGREAARAAQLRLRRRRRRPSARPGGEAEATRTGLGSRPSSTSRAASMSESTESAGRGCRRCGACRRCDDRSWSYLARPSALHFRRDEAASGGLGTYWGSW